MRRRGFHRQPSGQAPQTGRVLGARRGIADSPFTEVYQLATDMGGAGFIFTGDNDADITHNSAMISLNMLDACFRRNIRMIMKIAGKKLDIRHVTGPEGVRGRNSDNHLVRDKLGWMPTWHLGDGIHNTYEWIDGMVNSQKNAA